ncbi:MAG: rhomboid family intramembrane serine protease [Lachnospiraceae bacterium]|nr:rhomboid family intramembrane serine protease [Lachnospiraceae bacterium]
MNQWLNKMERKFGRYAIPDLTRYVVGLYCLGAVIGMLNQMGVISVNIYYNWLCLDMDAVFHGQVWRLFTYLLEPYGFYSGMGFLVSVLFLVIQVSLFFTFGRSLEQAWGTFRYNLYFFSGYVLNIIAALVLYLCPMHISLYNSGFQYIYWTMFLAFATIQPDMQLLLYFVIPIKVKWLAILDAIYLSYQTLSSLVTGIKYLRIDNAVAHQYGWMYISNAAAIVIAMANFLIFFFATRNYRRISPREQRRKRKFRKSMKQATETRGVRHRCAVCGRTQEEFPNLEFRYCSKCQGNYEYCSDHLFTHEHVKNFMQ